MCDVAACRGVAPARPLQRCRHDDHVHGLGRRRPSRPADPPAKRGVLARSAGLPGMLAAGALASNLLAGRLPPRLRVGLSGVLAGVSVLGFARWQLGRLFTEKPAYELRGRCGELELRQYPQLVQAETTVAEEDWDQALAEGFRRLATYVLGGNAQREHVSMTSPVLCSPAERDELEMSSPVTTRTPEGYTVAFLMPRGRGLPGLPPPRDSRVTLRALPARRVGVLRRRGRFTSERLRAEESRLLALVEQAGLSPISEPAFAAYDPPWTLPVLRRSEVWVDVADAQRGQTSWRAAGRSFR